MGKKCLIFVPHPDDEVNVGAGLFDYLKDDEWETTVVFLSNGRDPKGCDDRRLKELLRAKNFLGYQRVQLLGYGDGYVGDHIYNKNNDEEASSFANHRETYNVGNYQTFHFQKYGEQAPYTRNNIKNDIKSLLLKEKAQLIICSDCDSHPDHKLLSLLFDEAMGEILKINDYRPIVLKRFAYLGVWYGKKDYFKPIMVETKPIYNFDVDDNYSFPYKWEQRYAFTNRSINYPACFFISPVFKALKSHWSQHAVANIDRIVNADIVCWHRRVDGLQYNAELKADSGDVSFLNDFKIVDTDNIEEETPCIIPSKTKAWIPNSTAHENWVKFKFNTSRTVSKITVYLVPGSELDNLRLELDNGYKEDVIPKGYYVEFSFKPQHNILSFELHFSRYGNRFLGVYEIEAYSNHDCPIIDKLPFDLFDKEQVKRRNALLLYIYSLIFEFYAFFALNMHKVYLKRLYTFIKK